MSRKPLIVFTHGGGRLGNQLLSYAHLIAFLEEYPGRFDLLNVAFWPYAHLLKNTADVPACTHPTSHNRFTALRLLHDIIRSLGRLKRRFSGPYLVRHTWPVLLHRWGTYLPRAQSLLAGDILDVKGVHAVRRPPLDLASREAVDVLSRKSVTVLGGWGIRSWPLFEKHQGAIRTALAISPRFQKMADAFIAKLRAHYDLLIGVVIRQTDYRHIKGGRHFFETPRYVRWMQEAASVFGAGKQVGFVVASDEVQDSALFEDVHAHFAPGEAVGPGHYIENMAALAACDLILSPLSTFSAWAAFLGDTPLLQLKTTEQEIRTSDLMHGHIVDMLAEVC